MVIKKSVKSKSALRDHALVSGAAVADETGKQFNTSRKQATKKPVLEKDPDAKQLPAPAPEPPVADPGSKLVADAIEASARATAMMLGELKKQMAEIRMQVHEPILEWDFEFIRDDKGYTTNLRATAILPRKILN